MGGLYVHRSNSMEALAAALAGVVGDSGTHVWTPEVLVVQGRGMERWLSMRLVDELGVWANCRTPFPRAFVEELLDAAAGALESDPYRRLSLTLSLAAELERFDADEVARYVGGNSERRFSLAIRLADLYDRYGVYRPEWLLRGFPDPRHWQARLWRRVEEQLGPDHFAHRAQRAIAALKGDAPLPTPARVSVFGVTTLPPSYLALFRALSERSDVHFFVQTPSREYWGDTQRQLGLFGESDGPPLLEVLGKHARQFHELLEGLGYEPGAEAYREPGTATLLRVLQSDLLHYRRRCPERDPRPVALSSRDESLQVHACHSPMREAEVVHDVLLDCFERYPELEPHDVAVLVPRIDAYAPFIEAVFGTRGSLPYRIHDRAFGHSDPEHVALEAWLETARGRMSSAEVLDLLEHAPILRAFGLNDDAIETVRHWVVEAGIRWGFDREHRAQHGHPDDDTATWRFGLDRLWMGFAVDERRHPIVGDVAPATLLSGSESPLLGALEQLVQALAETGRRIAEPQPFRAWSEILETWVDRFTEPTSRLRAELRRRTAEVTALAASEPVPYPTMRELILSPLGRESASFGFGSGGVTVCEMLPMRAIPFDVVVVMGMNDQEFPRPRVRDGLDLTAEAPRKGDPDPLADDRHLFLEALLSARRQLVVTYVGHSIKGNESLPPSGVLAELLDTCRRTVRDPESELARLHRHHPLHPFSRRYFNRELYTFEKRYERAATATRNPAAPMLLARGRTPEPMQTLELNDLVAGLRRPPTFFLTRILGARRPRDAEPTPQREAIAIEGLDRWLHTDYVLERLEEAWDPETLARALRRGGGLPLGMAGELAAEELLGRASSLLDEARRLGGMGTARHHEVSGEVDSVRLVGRLGSLFGRRRIVVRASRIDAFDLRPWIHHVVGVAEGVIDTSVRIGFDSQGRVTSQSYRSLSPQEAREILRELVRVFDLGRRVPLPLIQEAASAYVRKRASGATDDEAREAAWRAFRGIPEYRDPLPLPLFDPEAAIRRGEVVCGEEDARFAVLAERVYGPLHRGLAP